MFVLYLGSKNVTGDFVGMVLRDNVLYGMYRLGGAFHSKLISNVTRSTRDPAYFDRVEFHRVYQDMEVIYTRGYTSADPMALPAVQLQPPDSLHNLLQLHPNSTAFYVGGFPQGFTPPVEMGQSLSFYDGCIESSMLNHKLLGLYNFQRVLNVNQERPCTRQVQQTEELYFDGTGYATVNIPKTRGLQRIQFSVKTLLKNALLFYVGNEKSYYSLTVEKGYLVLTGSQGGKVFSNRTSNELFPTARDKFKEINVRFNGPTVSLFETPPITIPYTKDVFNFLYIGGVPDSLRERDNIPAPALRGSLQRVPKLNLQSENFIELLGVRKGFRLDLLAVRDAEFKNGSALTEKPAPFKDMISLGFKTSEPGGILLQTTQGAQGLRLALADGHVEFEFGSRQAVRSNRKYNDGRWHYLTALRNELALRVDDRDTGTHFLSPDVTKGQNLTLGGEVFTGSLGDLYIRRPTQQYMPADLSLFTQKGDVTLGLCAAERPAQAIRTKHGKSSKKKTQKQKIRHRKKKSGSRPDGQSCKSPVALPQTFSLTSPDSQLSYHISPQELNYRPYFSLVMKTTSTEGLILHINGKHSAHVALYMIGGKIKLAVGKRVIYYNKKMNDNEWHKVDFSVEEKTFHLLVDFVRVPDGQLPAETRAGLNLRSPVYLGADLTTPSTAAQRKSLPKAAVTGCFYNVKFQNELLREPLTKSSLGLCFDGEMESGIFFYGDKDCLASQTPLMVKADFHLTFNIRPRDLTGLLFYARGQNGRYISVYLQNDKIIAQAHVGGDRPYSVSIPISSNLCDSFHSVTVHKQNSVIKLGLDSKSRRIPGPYAAFNSNAQFSFYFGDVPGNLREQLAPLERSYVGCLRGVKLNGADVVLSHCAPNSSVSLQGCPVK
ncbi:laminin subunit alpha-3-like [Sardina pilchardus]|uniref:laminin subunit alpha-3-like n=1 Tax=Sardina pilchardus TaxID=27697 RepID=UPI002E0ED7D0